MCDHVLLDIQPHWTNSYRKWYAHVVTDTHKSIRQKTKPLAHPYGRTYGGWWIQSITLLNASTYLVDCFSIPKQSLTLRTYSFIQKLKKRKAGEVQLSVSSLPEAASTFLSSHELVTDENRLRSKSFRAPQWTRHVLSVPSLQISISFLAGSVVL